MVLINGVPYNELLTVTTTIEHMGMLPKSIEAFFVLYNYNKYTLLSVSARLNPEVYLNTGWVYIVFTYTLTTDLDEFMQSWGKS